MFNTSPRILVIFPVTPDCSQKFNTRIYFRENENLLPTNRHCMDWYISYFRYITSIFPIIFSLYGTNESLETADFLWSTSTIWYLTFSKISFLPPIAWNEGVKFPFSKPFLHFYHFNFFPKGFNQRFCTSPFYRVLKTLNQILILFIPKTLEKWIPIVREKYRKRQTFKNYGLLKYFSWSRNPYNDFRKMGKMNLYSTGRGW